MYHYLCDLSRSAGQKNKYCENYTLSVQGGCGICTTENARLKLKTAAVMSSLSCPAELFLSKLLTLCAKSAIIQVR